MNLREYATHDALGLAALVAKKAALEQAMPWASRVPPLHVSVA